MAMVYNTAFLNICLSTIDEMEVAFNDELP